MSSVGLAMLIGAAVFAGVAIYVWRLRTSPGAKALTLMLVAGVTYTLCYALELSVSGIDHKQFWGDLKYLGIGLLPVAWLAFTLQFTGRGRWLTRPMIALLAVEPALILALLAMSDTHALVRFYPPSQAGLRFPVAELGPLGWTNVVYAYALLLITSALFATYLFRLSTPYRRPASVLLLALLVPLVANVLYNFGIGPFGTIDITPFAFTVAIAVLVWGILHLRLLNIVPVARHVVLETLDDGVIVLDAALRVVDLNPAARRILGVDAWRAVGRPIGLLLPGHELLIERQRGGEVLREEIRLGEFPVVRDFEVTVSPLPDQNGRSAGRLLVLRDVSERKAADEQLERLAHFDPLTGLPNRKLFGDRLAQAIIRARRSRTSVGLLFLDVDRFKVANDTYGHDVGDLVLKGIALRLRGCLREEDTVARLGGDEFTIILPDLGSPSDAGMVASKVQACLRRPIVARERELHVTASIGVAVWPADGSDAEALLRNADLAMYRAKTLGANRFEFYSAALSARARVRLQLEEDLRRAPGRNELVVHYQPIRSLSDGRTVAEEALVRWRHPSRGLLTPADFLWLAEETDLIADIDRWVLAASCRAAAERARSNGKVPVSVAVNLSARSLRAPDLAPTVAAILRETGVPPGSITMEISESVVMDEAGSALEALHQLKSLGVGLSLDDFGTGSTALGQLKRIPLDTLKIDRVFVSGVDHEREDRVIVGAMISLAHALGLTVVAEGIERAGQLEVLRDLGCDLGQGYLFARPEPRAEEPVEVQRIDLARA
jgi:diguanylate cyclase (GGDEF)-like protein/PAS domain S-box-containing protein